MGVKKRLYLGIKSMDLLFDRENKKNVDIGFL